MPTYELRAGTFRHDGEKHEPGDHIELEEHRVESYADSKFERVDDDADDSSDSTDEPDDHESEPAAADDASASDETDGSLPDDYDELRTLASTYDGDEVDGNSPKDHIREFFEDWPSDDLRALKADAEL